MLLFPIIVSYAGIAHVLLWLQDDIDLVLTRPSKRILDFASTRAATQYARGEGYQVASEELAMIHLDWIAQGHAFLIGDIDCSEALAAWNLFADIAASIPERASAFLAKDKKPSGTYDKLFWGNNIPAVTPAGEHFEPAWSRDELAEMESVLVAGLMLFCKNLEAASSAPSATELH
jgi:hypothetical protein